MLVLGIESSCDETAAAVVRDGEEMLSNVIASQIDVHREYGGVVPEIASRKHIEAIMPVIMQALSDASVSLDDIEGIAVTRGPGLIGSLLVGLSVAKSIALARNLPFVGVNHLEGHINAIFLSDDKPDFPFIALVVSGGHTSIYQVKGFGNVTIMGQTRDDAAGEAFDKAAKMLDLGYPGGVVIDRLARQSNISYVHFPRSMKDSRDFSFSGLKTSLLNYIKKRDDRLEDEEVPHIVASYQEAIVDVLVEKTLRVAQETSVNRVVVSGGVAANGRLRTRFLECAREKDIAVHIPPPVLCTDNAAMIAAVGEHLLMGGLRDSYDLNAISRWPLEMAALR
ncbi:MAG TPA: tRNA (adenosine(37)-N6)-threonylcarbamoyltransferase complex transferase subunit TsaD [Deltaproteobacteria bacterium]|nr:tRNA (adenosine(37)-N6)-threonylcarbamoyltransferase complex transferase subunit TsaD [Deltaproteobacteria bacterium]